MINRIDIAGGDWPWWLVVLVLFVCVIFPPMILVLLMLWAVRMFSKE